MTRPRSQQINDLQTRYSRLRYTPTPGAVSDTVPLATVYASTVTDQIGGVEESVWAAVRSTATPPYPISAGDAITISVDGSPSVNVTFASTDTTASRVAAKINAAVGSTVAYVSAGQLTIKGLFLGSKGVVVLADFVAGTLAKLGLTAGTFNGEDAPARGIVTLSADTFDRELGGTALLRTTDGQDIVVDAPASKLVSEGFLPPVRALEVPGGAPVHARVRGAGSNLVLEYHARMPTRAEVETFNSDLASLDATDTVNLTITDTEFGGPTALVLTFPSGPALTRDQVVTRINSLFAAASTLSGSGAAHVTGYVGQPYSFSGISSIDIAVDGGAFTTVDLSAATDAATAAAIINGAVTGITASAASVGAGTFLELRSNNTDGTTSSIEIRPPGGDVTDAFKTLGLIPGKYRGYFVCQPSGPSEIKFYSIGRGSQASVRFSSGNPTSLARLGVTAGTTYGSDDGEEPVSFPSLGRISALSTSVLALIPEVMDFGEVPDDAVSTTSRFADKASGVAATPATKIYSVDGLYIEGPGQSAAGRAAALNPDGLLPSSAASLIRAEYENLFKYLVRGDFAARTVAVVVANNIEGGGSNGNPAPVSDTFIVDVDPTDFYVASSRRFEVRFGRDGFAFSPFYVEEVAPAIDSIDWFVNARDNGGLKAAFANRSGPMRVYDANTEAAGAATGGKKVIPLSSSTATQGDDTLRIRDVKEGNLEAISLFRQINAKHGITVGDGTNSFGEFNGADAIQQALAFFSAHAFGIGSLRIKVKHGSYAITAANPIAVPANTTLILEGEGNAVQNTILIMFDSGTATTVASGSTLELRSLDLKGFGFDFSVQVNAGGRLKAFDVTALRTSFQFNDGLSGHFERCDIEYSGFSSGTITAPLLDVRAGDGVEKDGLTLVDCKLVGAPNVPVLKVGPSGSTGLTVIDRVSFVRCKITCGYATVDGNNNLTGNPGVIDIDPGSAGGSLTSSFGPYLKKAEWIDCDVTADRSGGTTTVLMHLLPVANAAYTTASPYDVTLNSAMRIDQVVIKGGRWVAPRSNTLVNPFTVGLAVYHSTTSSKQFGKVTIKDWRFEFDTSTTTHVSQGAPTQDLDSFFTTPLATDAGHPSTSSWGAIAISAMDLVMKDCELLGLNQNGNSGDLFLKVDRWADVDNVLIDQYVTGTTASLPDQRVRTRFGTMISIADGYPNVSMNRVKVHGTNAASGTWVNHAIWYHEPSVTKVLVKDSEISWFQEAGANHSHYGFEFVDAGANGIWGTTYGNPGTLDYFTLDGLRSQQNLIGVYLIRISGIDYIRRFDLRNCDIQFNTQYGFSLVAVGIWPGAVTMSGNKITQNGSGGFAGVYIVPGTWTVVTPSLQMAYVTMTGNQVFNNNSSPFLVQCQITTSTVGTEKPLAALYGNSFTQDGSGGQLKTDWTNGGASTALTSPSTNMTIRGVETGYVGGASPGSSRYFGSLGTMFHNMGQLVTP